jgi:hypothetical protein
MEDGKIIDFKQEALKGKVEQWAQHPDVQIGCSFFITALMMQGFSKFVLNQTIQDNEGDSEIIQNCIFEGAQRYMQGEDGNAHAFSPLQLQGNLRTSVKYIDQFLAQLDGEVFNDGSEVLQKAAEEIKEILEAKSITLIGVSGKKGSGKDEVAQAVNSFRPEDSNLAIVKFADALKDATCALLNCTREELEDQNFKETECGISGMTYRKFLQRFGTEAMRDTFGSNFWIQCLVPTLKEQANTLSNGSYILVTDTRFLSEAEFLRSCGGKILRVNRPGLPEDLHVSETELDTYDFDMVIENDETLADLYEKVEENVT